jgi:hypothetical protein
MYAVRNKLSGKTLIYLASGMLTAAILFTSTTTHVTAAEGITVSPANIGLTLPKDSFQAETSIKLTNNYSQPITLQLSIEASTNANDKKAISSITIDGDSSLTLPAGETASKTLHLHDSEQLAPGSAQAYLIISQPVAPVNVGIAPQLRLPINIVKQDGAITAVELKEIMLPAFTLTMPKIVSVKIKNTGNTLAIPRGTIGISKPDGKFLSRGVLNTGSVAIAPGHAQQLQTNSVKISDGRWPGIYAVNVSYSLGGDNPVKTATSNFIYVAWWQILILAGLCIGAFLTAKTIFRSKHFVNKKHPPKRKRGPLKRLVL